MCGSESGAIFDIQRFSLHDGPGIRTTVFLKGCPLRCLWCHNPEALSFGKDFLYRASKCVGCGACAKACKYGVHSFHSGEHDVLYKNCAKCGACAQVCCYGAVEVIGYSVTVGELMEEIEKDAPYYKNGGGVTLSGGEPMAQAPFALCLAKAVKERDINLCVETSGYAANEDFEKIAPYVDTFLYDYKATDSQEHKNLTGVGNALIRQNLGLINDLGKDIVLRCPLVPGVNDSPEHLRGIAETAAGHAMIKKVELLPYHKMGELKYTQLGDTKERPVISVPTQQLKQQWIETLKSLNCTNVVI